MKTFPTQSISEAKRFRVMGAVFRGSLGIPQRARRKNGAVAQVTI